MRLLHVETSLVFDETFHTFPCFGSFLPTGFSAGQLFGQGTCYTYDDVIMHPGHIFFGAHEVDLTSKITRNISLRTPIVSSPMDTVTEGEMAIAMAMCGGLGFVHYNTSVEEQVSFVDKCKRHTPGYVATPICLGPEARVVDIDHLKINKGFSSVCITDTGAVGGK